MTYLIADVAPKNNNTDNVRMIEPAEDLHLAPDAALVALDLLLRDDLERDLNAKTLVVGARGALRGLREGGEVRRGAEGAASRRVRARRNRFAPRGCARVARGGCPTEGDVHLARGNVPCCTLLDQARSRGMLRSYERIPWVRVNVRRNGQLYATNAMGRLHTMTLPKLPTPRTL